VYIGEQFSAARAARALYTHRNTVLNRLPHFLYIYSMIHILTWLIRAQWRIWGPIVHQILHVAQILQDLFQTGARRAHHGALVHHSSHGYHAVSARIGLIVWLAPSIWPTR
jgi:hypothetical protein